MNYTQAQLEQHWQPMVRVAQGVLGSRDEAEECAAAAIVQVLERRPAAIENMEAFMVTVAKRRAVDRHRALARAYRRDARLAAHASLTAADVAEDVVQRAAARWMSAEASRRLSPQSHRILIAIANDENLQDVAVREGMSLRAVQSDLFRSRRLLRAIWARALAAVGGLWAGCRQAPHAAVPAVTAAVALTVLPAGGPQQVAPDTAGRGSLPVAPQTAAFVGPAAVARVVRPATPAATFDRALTPARALTARETAVVKVQDPAGRTTLYTDRHGDGEDAGLVGGAVACLGNLSVDPHQLGC